MKLENTSFVGNYAKSGTNGMQLINSKVFMTDCVIDNSVNNLKFPIEFRTSIPYGFINMNYESNLEMQGVSISYLSGIKASFAYSAG